MQFLKQEFNKILEILGSGEFWFSIFSFFFKIALIFIMASIIIKVSRKIIGRIFSQNKKKTMRMTERREKTLKKLIENALVYTVYTLAILTLLETIGIKIGPLLAGAGIAGLAIGFGAQSLVKDVISGFFIVFEDQFAVGDYVYVAGVEGDVEEIGLRTTKIKDWTGERYVIPNGNITQVTNYSIHNGVPVIDINIPYENDVYEAKKVIEDINQKVFQTTDIFLTEPEVIGVQTFDVSHYVIRIIAETTPGEQWSAERYLREVIQSELYSRGIAIPAPRLVMYSEKEKLDKGD
ncbi:MAG TPA: mechanosensitive ion channel family protein [Pseudogracilibacillus sp.]|nr:mechanosensitive ion channel family protein [Pseudogracilibacillus sp.]